MTQQLYRDLPLKPNPKGRPFLCPRCKGYGAWFSDATTKTMTGCAQCIGWGWVTDADRSCLHHFEVTKSSIRSFDKIWTCTDCGQQREVDTSG